MYIIKNVKLPLDTNFSDITSIISKITGLTKNDIISAKLHKKAVDARKKNNIHFLCSFVVKVSNEKKFLSRAKKLDFCKLKQEKYIYQKAVSKVKPIVVGFGPAGIFAAYALAKAGLNPIIIERGKNVDDRINDVETFFSTGKLNENSNIQFGEGGAGTFSDGKLNTGVNDFRIKEILDIFYKHGANESILYDSKPHIGTDILTTVIKSIRQEIIKLGGAILFEHKLKRINFEDKNLKSITVIHNNKKLKFECDSLILALGHSARDTFEMLRDSNFDMQPKAFAIGARIEHKAIEINKAQYGSFYSHPALCAADYKLSCHLNNGRSVFTFCMCPGGEVINASSESGGIVTNGMSNFKRDSENSNSALLVNVNVADYYKNDVLDGMYFQREIEQKAYQVGKGNAVCENIASFLNGSSADKGICPTFKPNVAYDKLDKVLPSFVIDSLKQALPIFDKKINGFANEQAVLTAPETRSSSPVRIIRDENFESNFKGIFPCGEGAGYAGGIMSAAIDGLKCAEALIKKIKASN